MWHFVWMLFRQFIYLKIHSRIFTAMPLRACLDVTTLNWLPSPLGIWLCNRMNFVNRSLRMLGVGTQRQGPKNKQLNPYFCSSSADKSRLASVYINATQAGVCFELYLVRPSAVIEMIKQISPVLWRCARHCSGRRSHYQECVIRKEASWNDRGEFESWKCEDP